MKTRRRGEPIIVLGMLLLGWTALRIAVWHWPDRDPADRELQATDASTRSPTGNLRSIYRDATAANRDLSTDEGMARPTHRPGMSLKPLRGDNLLVSPIPDGSAFESAQAPVWRAGPQPSFFAPSRSHDDIRWVRNRMDSNSKQNAQPRAPVTESNIDHWRLDAWALYRSGGNPSTRIAGGVYPPTYGSSQAGIVLRYAPWDEPHRTAVYARLSGTPSQPGEVEAAVGIGARPLAKVPLRGQLELRGMEQSGQVELRPAAFLVTELAPVELPSGFIAETYLQAGYVSGSFPSAFADGQVRMEREAAMVAGGRLRLGGGIWGGVQRDAGRLDIGPSATMEFSSGKRTIRLSADYRVRAAGDASPGNGLALTLSTGF